MKTIQYLIGAVLEWGMSRSQPFCRPILREMQLAGQIVSIEISNDKIHMSNGGWEPIEAKIGRIPQFDIWALTLGFECGAATSANMPHRHFASYLRDTTIAPGHWGQLFAIRADILLNGCNATPYDLRI